MVNTEIRLIIFFEAKDGEALYSQQKEDRELTVAQIMNSLLPNSGFNWRKVGKTTRPFRYDLNQIPYDYTVEVRNRFKGLYLIECLMNYGLKFVTLYRRQGSRPSQWKFSHSVVFNSLPPHGFPVHHQLPEVTQSHIHGVSDIHPGSHPLLSPSPPAPNPSQHQSLYQWVNSSHEVLLSH